MMGQMGEPRYLRPLLIAEIGVNHEGDFERAKRMIDLVSTAGGHVAKFQSYKADLLAMRDSPAYWDRASEPSSSQFELFNRYDSFGPDEFRALAEHCTLRGIEFMSTPFDLQAVEMLDPLVRRFKVASADVTNVPLLERVACTEKPVIMSTGAATRGEIERAVAVLREGGAEQITLLHCVLNYPTPPQRAQLSCIKTLADWFPECEVGYSDHVPPGDNGTLPSIELAALMGAAVIEKHFTDDKSLQGNDHYHAMDAGDLNRFVERLSLFTSLLGDPKGVRRLEWEAAARKHARRSIVTVKRLSPGERLTAAVLTTKRPASGIGAEHWTAVLGREVRHAIDPDVPLQWRDLA